VSADTVSGGTLLGATGTGLHDLDFRLRATAAL
jgi:hypothetical protein